MTDKHSNNHPPPEPRQDNSWRPLKLEYELYDELFDNLDVSEDEKREYLETVWAVVVAFVDMRFRIHPLQQACEQDLDLLMVNLLGVLDSKGSPINLEFNKVTDNAKRGV